MRLRVFVRIVAAACVSLAIVLPNGLVRHVGAQSSNPIVIENQQPGSTGWMLWDSHQQSGFTTTSQVEGYTSSPSVNKGAAISFHVSVNPAQNYRIEIYRIGWYGGKGGRLMQTVGPLPGTSLGACPLDSATGLIECHWPAGYTLTVPTAWTSGVYVASVVNSQNYMASLVFVVRDDGRVADFLYQQPLFTAAAYSNFPNDGTTGKSLYDYNSYGPNTAFGTKRAVKVSLDRPTRSEFKHLNGDDWSWQNYLIYWLEREGYDVAYATDLDAHLYGSQFLLRYKAVISAGHDEYWTKEMRDAFETARDSGTNLAFMGANPVGWQVRLEPSSTGTPNRVIVGYKSSTLDPITAGSLKTDQFRLLSPPRPEQTLVGVQYVNENDGLPPNLPPFIATNTSHWIYDNTGLTVGSQVPHLIGYEVDQLFPTYQAPTSLSYTTLGDSLLPVGTSSVHANASIYQAPRGSWVFASGTMSWSWALGRAGYENAGIQQMMRNLFTRFGVVSNPNTPPSVTLTSPANGAGFTAPATVALAATASDSGGSITKVEFYNGATLLGSDTTSPYAFTWSNVPQGSYTLTARAYDNGGLTTTSTSVGIAVAAQPTNTPPSVALTSPADGASFRDRSTITLSAAATDTDGTIAKVEFYNGSTRLQTDSQGPYTYDWRGVRRGTYTLTARAYDSGGLSTTSAPVVITVTR